MRVIAGSARGRPLRATPSTRPTADLVKGSIFSMLEALAYKRGFEGAHKDPLIGLGTAPLEDPYFRAALFEQLGNNDLEGPVTTDIAGKKVQNGTAKTPQPIAVTMRRPGKSRAPKTASAPRALSHRSACSSRSGTFSTISIRMASASRPA